MSWGTYNDARLKELQDEREKGILIGKLVDGDKDYHTPCGNCDAVPTVHPTELCGPCCFGEADTAGGNW